MTPASVMPAAQRPAKANILLRTVLILEPPCNDLPKNDRVVVNDCFGYGPITA
jgi:hypothetical protein